MYGKARAFTAVAALTLTCLVGNSAAIASEELAAEVPVLAGPSAVVVVEPATADDFPAKPAVGKTMTLKTSSGTTEVFQASATCTMTYTTSVPYKSSNAMHGQVSAARSSGCSSYMSVTAYMIQGSGLGASIVWRGGNWVYPGTKSTWFMNSGTCKYGFDRYWSTAVGSGSGGYAAQSPKGLSPCEV